MTQENQPSEETGTKLTNKYLWFRFWINGEVQEHSVGHALTSEDIVAKFDKPGFSPFTTEHFRVLDSSGVTDVIIDHPLYKKLYEH